MTADPLAPLLDLPGVAEAAAEAGEALAAVHRHPVNLRGWDKTSRESSWRGGRSSAAMEGATTELNREHDFDDPVMAGAIRVAQALDPDSLDREVAVFRRAPMRSLARLHSLAAAELVDDDTELGRPRAEPHIAQRLDLLGQLVTGATQVPAAVLAAVVHGELLALAPFEKGNAVVARGASRLVTASTGLDPHLLGVPEVSWLRHLGDYRELSALFATGDPQALADWIVLSCRAMTAGAAEARTIADAARS
ncbi:oxidoreductase [Gordonia sp. PP30]|uniref:oxidoreductase n=1 Tax=Gordonia sp. PP30 TaxID=2935861 RepID=UPI001FFFD68C|nr:oxidoreductase [Gordonia sp. PP30]UQE75379.1 oxidoreductase [Gordonia sp. PP30]